MFVGFDNEGTQIRLKQLAAQCWSYTMILQQFHFEAITIFEIFIAKRLDLYV